MIGRTPGLRAAGLRKAGAPDSTGGPAAVPFVASGALHAAGTVPDPGAVAGAVKFLREDATWAAPPAGGPVVISDFDFALQSSISSSVWAAGAYSRLDLVLLTSNTASTNGWLSLVGTGLSGTYNATLLYSQNGIAATSYDYTGNPSSSGWVLFFTAGTSGPCVFEGTLQIKTGLPRFALFRGFTDSSSIKWSDVRGRHTDTAHDVTGVTVNFGGSGVSGHFRLIGWP